VLKEVLAVGCDALVEVLLVLLLSALLLSPAAVVCELCAAWLDVLPVDPVEVDADSPAVDEVAADVVEVSSVLRAVGAAADEDTETVETELATLVVVSLL